MARRAVFDPWLLVTTGVLVASGLFMVGSASNSTALEIGKDPSTYWWRHMAHLFIGYGRPEPRLVEQSIALNLVIEVCGRINTIDNERGISTSGATLVLALRRRLRTALLQRGRLSHSLLENSNALEGVVRDDQPDRSSLL